MQILSYVKYESNEFNYTYENLTDFCEDYPTHTHNAWEFILVKKGALSYSVDGNVFDIGPGNMIVSRPGSIHSLCTNGAIHYERYNLIVAEQLLFKDLIDRIPADLHVLNTSGNPIFLNLYEKLIFYYSHLQGEHLDIIVHNLINELWTNIYIAAQNPSLSVAAQSNAVISKVINYIKDHIREPLTAQSICDSLFISHSYLNHCFSKYMSLTPKHYIMLQKMQLVHQALSEGANPTEICREFGFRNYSTFYRNYQKIYGYRPSDNPKQSLQKIEL